MGTKDLDATDLTRKHWNEKIAARVLAAWRESGTSLNGFARANGLNAERLRSWRKRIGGGADVKTPTVAPMTFIPAAVMGTARVAVRLPRGVELEGDIGAISVEWVAALARELGRS
jgi:hypothetical protein